MKKIFIYLLLFPILYSCQSIEISEDIVFDYEQFTKLTFMSNDIEVKNLYKSNYNAPFIDHVMEKNPSDYMYYFNYGKNFKIIGSSPEMFLKVKGKKVMIRPVAGTTGIDKDKDFSKNLFNLKNSEKDQAEHMMLVDLAEMILEEFAKLEQ